MIAALAAALIAAAPYFPEGRFPSYADPVTGAVVYNLTPGDARDQIVYQTHPMWSPRMRFLLFASDRSGGGMRPHALRLADGEIRPLLEEGVPVNGLSPCSGRFYYVAGRALMRLPIEAAFEGRAAPQHLAELPAAYAGFTGGIAVSARERVVYAAAALPDSGANALVDFDLPTRAWRERARVAFKVGHLQAAPRERAGLAFCHETGGDAPQRTWHLPRGACAPVPLYPETYGEWVTHEVWWGARRVLFTVWPYDDAHKAQPHGILSYTLGSSGPEVWAQYPAWHTQASPDGRYLLGDDFDRNLWLVRTRDKQRRLLTAGHAAGAWKTHPHASFTPDARAILLNSSRHGNEDLLLVPLPDFDSLPPAP